MLYIIFIECVVVGETVGEFDVYPFIIADVDGVINENGEKVIFEAKTASSYKQEIWEDGVPAEYILQVQHYMAVTGAKKLISQHLLAVIVSIVIQLSVMTI